jgi:hypothetical protein
MTGSEEEEEKIVVRTGRKCVLLSFYAMSMFSECPEHGGDRVFLFRSPLYDSWYLARRSLVC